MFTDPGATAEDTCAGPLPVTVSGQVNTAAPGQYRLTYIAEDHGGLRGIARRNVEVRCNCLLQSAEVLYPPQGSVVRVGSGPAAALMLRAAVDCPEDTADIQFILDGVPLGNPTPMSASFSSSIGSIRSIGSTLSTLSTTSTLVYELPVANLAASPAGVLHTLLIEATDSAGGTISAQSTFTVATTPVQANGLPAAALAELFTQEGDSFFGEGTLDGRCLREIAMIAWDADISGVDPLVDLARPEDPAAGVRISAPRTLLMSGERGVLVALLACDTPETLLDDGVENLDIWPGDLVPGSNFFFATVLTTTDGVAFTEIDPLRLDSNPLSIAIRGLLAKSGLEPALYAHPGALLEDPMALSGLSGTWNTAVLAPDGIGADTLDLEAAATGIFGLFEVDPEGPRLQVTPDPQYDLVLGLVLLGESVDTEITVENIGTGILEGAIALDAGPEFQLLGTTPTYRLGPGQRTAPGSILVRYTPTAVREDQAALHFTDTGDGDPTRTEATLTILGTGAETPSEKRVTLFGCGPVSTAQHIGLGDAVLFLAVLLFLLRKRPASRRL